MDLLLSHYGSEESDNETTPPKCHAETLPDDDDGDDGECEKTTKASSDKEKSTTLTRKRKRGQVTVLQQDEDDSPLFQRSQPPIRGNWVGHVFIVLQPLIVKQLKEQQQQATASWKDQLEVSGWTGRMQSHDVLHVSLSRPFYMQRGSIQSFVSALKERLQYVATGWLRLLCYNPTVLCNDEKTRSFLTWPVDANPFLLTLVRHTNDVLSLYGEPPYYDPPLFHVSIASIPGVVATTATNSSAEASPVEVVVPVTEIQCTFGSIQSYSIPLSLKPCF
jgi:hypothetical protein